MKRNVKLRLKQETSIPRAFRCEFCNNRMVAYKTKGQMTPIAHVKHMWCYICMDVTAHIQQTKWE